MINQCHNLHPVPTTYARFSSPHECYLEWATPILKKTALFIIYYATQPLIRVESWVPIFLYFLNNVDHKLPRVFTTTGHGP